MVERAQPGRAWHPPRAADWNAIGETTEWYQRFAKTGLGGSPQLTLPLTDIVFVKNSSGAARSIGDVLEISGFQLDDVVQDSLYFTGSTPNASRPFAIVRQQMAADEINRAQISGACIANVNIGNAAHTHAVVSSGSCVLQSAYAGPVRILHKPSGTGQKVCAVLIGAPWPGGSSSSYVGYTSGGITARSGTTAGSGTVRLYYLNGATLTAYTENSSYVDVTAYNLSTTAVGSNKYVQLKRESLSNQFVVDWEDCE